MWTVPVPAFQRPSLQPGQPAQPPGAALAGGTERDDTIDRESYMLQVAICGTSRYGTSHCPEFD